MGLDTVKGLTAQKREETQGFCRSLINRSMGDPEFKIHREYILVLGNLLDQ